MNSNTISEIMSVMGTSLAPMPYFKDRYGMLLTGWEAGEGTAVSELKRRGYDKYLQKPLLRELIAKHSTLSQGLLEQQWPANVVYLRRSLDSYGYEDGYRWNQTSRPGTSLVLCLNLSGGLNAMSDRILKGSTEHLIAYRNHFRPESGCNLSWARLDLDWETGEVLIEEIQNDFLRTAKFLHGHYKTQGPPARQSCIEKPMRIDLRLSRLFENHLKELEKLWEEATLIAALDFIRNELGLRKVYMHTAEWGWKLKGIAPNHRPPTSIYSDLPRRFGFKKVDEIPLFLQETWASMGRDHLKHFHRRGDLWAAQFHKICL